MQPVSSSFYPLRLFLLFYPLISTPDVSPNSNHEERNTYASWPALLWLFRSRYAPTFLGRRQQLHRQIDTEYVTRLIWGCLFQVARFWPRRRRLSSMPWVVLGVFVSGGSFPSSSYMQYKIVRNLNMESWNSEEITGASPSGSCDRMMGGRHAWLTAQTATWFLV
jgi:hypothetical protein